MANLNELDRPRTDRTTGRPGDPFETPETRPGDTRYLARYEGRTGVIWGVLGLLVLAVLVIAYALSGNSTNETPDVNIQATPPAAEDTVPPAEAPAAPTDRAPATEAPAEEAPAEEAPAQ